MVIHFADFDAARSKNKTQTNEVADFMEIEIFLASSLEKVFPQRRPAAQPSGQTLSTWRGTRAAVQLVYTVKNTQGLLVPQFSLEVSGGPVQPSVRSVELLPSEMPCYEKTDDNYLCTEPGLYPDLLQPVKEAVLRPVPGQYRAAWLTWDIPEDAKPGSYDIAITARGMKEWQTPLATLQKNPDADSQVFTNQLTLCVRKAQLPPQKLLHTEWFHADCLASYYHVQPLSEEHWAILDKFIGSAAEHGINMLLTPVFTPSLDTAVGHERPTVQLVDVVRENGQYRFGFEKLERWTGLCKKHGISHLEIAHFFTQWGARATPKILAQTEKGTERIFGWDVPATSPEYRKFLESFIPALRQELMRLGFDKDHVWFHISDEPSPENIDSYHAAHRQVDDLLTDCRVIDALADIQFYREGLVRTPIPSVNHIQPFLDEKIEGLWSYYCCGQNYKVTNRFFAMPSARNRIMGTLWYLHNIAGFLQWGFNFYYRQYSLGLINPYQVTDAGRAFPSGDAFLVYPGENGEPLSSIRAEVQDDALLDLRALQLLDSLAGREETVKLIEELAGMKNLNFDEYPKDADFLLSLRERVAEEIDRRLA